MEEEFYCSDDLGFIIEDDSVKLIREEYPYVLYSTDTGIFPFVKYETLLAQLNDYIFYSNQYFMKELENKKNLEEEMCSKSNYFEETYHFTHDHLVWDWLTKEVHKCNIIVLLLSFLEGSLKEIFDWFIEEKKYIPKKKEKGMGKIDYYIEEVSSCCSYNIKEKITQELSVIESAKEIRNIFIHEFDAYYNDKHKDVLDYELKDFKVTSLIESISIILFYCEQAGINSGILEC